MFAWAIFAVRRLRKPCSGIKSEPLALRTRFHIDSAGTHDYHVGDPPDERAQKAAMRRGYEANGLRARRVHEKDFEVFHYILAMDKSNLAILEQECPPQYSHKLGLLMQYSKNFEGVKEVPDPYFGGHQGFEHVLNLVEEAGRGLLSRIRYETATE